MAKQALSFLTGGLNEVSRPDLIADDQLSESLNYIIDGTGRLVKRRMIAPYSVPSFTYPYTNSSWSPVWHTALGYNRVNPASFALEQNTFWEFSDFNSTLSEYANLGLSGYEEMGNINFSSSGYIPDPVEDGGMYNHISSGFYDIRYVSEPYYPTQKPEDMTGEFMLFVFGKIKGTGGGAIQYRLKLMYKAQDGWKWVDELDEIYTVFGVNHTKDDKPRSNVEVVYTSDRVYILDGVNRVVTLYVNSDKEIIVGSTGIDSPLQKPRVHNQQFYIYSDYDYNQNLSEGFYSGFQDTGLGDIGLFQCTYTVVSDIGDESNPAPLSDWLNLQVFDTEADLITDKFWINEIDIYGLGIPKNIPESQKKTLKYFKLYYRVVRYSEGKLVSNLKFTKQVEIKQKDYDDEYNTGNNYKIDASLLSSDPDLSYENDSYVIAKTLDESAGVKMLGNISKSVVFPFKFQHFVPIILNNKNEDYYTDAVIRVRISDSDINVNGDIFNWDNFLANESSPSFELNYPPTFLDKGVFQDNAMSSVKWGSHDASIYSKLIRMYDTNANTPLMVCIPRYTGDMTFQDLYVKIPLLSPGKKTIYLCFTDPELGDVDSYPGVDDEFNDVKDIDDISMDENIGFQYGRFWLNDGSSSARQQVFDLRKVLSSNTIVVTDPYESPGTGQLLNRADITDAKEFHMLNALGMDIQNTTYSDLDGNKPQLLTPLGDVNFLDYSIGLDSGFFPNILRTDKDLFNQFNSDDSLSKWYYDNTRCPALGTRIASNKTGWFSNSEHSGWDTKIISGVLKRGTFYGTMVVPNDGIHDGALGDFDNSVVQNFSGMDNIFNIWFGSGSSTTDLIGLEGISFGFYPVNWEELTTGLESLGNKFRTGLQYSVINSADINDGSSRRIIRGWNDSQYFNFTRPHEQYGGGYDNPSNSDELEASSKTFFYLVSYDLELDNHFIYFSDLRSGQVYHEYFHMRDYGSDPRDFDWVKGDRSNSYVGQGFNEVFFEAITADGSTHYTNDNDTPYYYENDNVLHRTRGLPTCHKGAVYGQLTAIKNRFIDNPDTAFNIMNYMPAMDDIVGFKAGITVHDVNLPDGMEFSAAAALDEANEHSGGVRNPTHNNNIEILEPKQTIEKTYPNMLLWNDAGKNSFPDLNYKLTKEDVLKVIAAPSFLKFEYANTFLIFTRNEIYRFVLKGDQATWSGDVQSMISESSKYGLYAPESLIKVGDSLFWLSEAGVVEWSSEGMRLISKDIVNIPIDKDMKAIYFSKDNSIGFALKAYVNESDDSDDDLIPRDYNAKIWDGETWNHTCYVYQIPYKAWTKFSFDKLYPSIINITKSDEKEDITLFFDGNKSSYYYPGEYYTGMSARAQTKELYFENGVLTRSKLQYEKEGAYGGSPFLTFNTKKFSIVDNKLIEVDSSIYESQGLRSEKWVNVPLSSRRGKSVKIKVEDVDVLNSVWYDLKIKGG